MYMYISPEPISEWQPVRIAPVSNWCSTWNPVTSRLTPFVGKIVRVRTSVSLGINEGCQCSWRDVSDQDAEDLAVAECQIQAD